MSTTMKVFVAALVACGVIALLAGGSRDWGHYALGSLMLAAVAAGVFALLRLVGGRHHRPTAPPR